MTAGRRPCGRPGQAEERLGQVEGRPGRAGSMGGQGRRERRDPVAGMRGSATAEFAVALPAVVVVLAVALWAVSVVEARLRCVDAARAGARAAARGEPLDRVEAAVAAAAPAGATVSVVRTGEFARVEVVAVSRPAWAVIMPSITLTASAASATEPGVIDVPTGPVGPADAGGHGAVGAAGEVPVGGRSVGVSGRGIAGAAGEVPVAEGAVDGRPKGAIRKEWRREGGGIRRGRRGDRCGRARGEGKGTKGRRRCGP